MVKVFKHAVFTAHNVEAAVTLMRRTLLICVTHAASSAPLIVTTLSLCRQASAALGSTWLESQRGGVCRTSPDGIWPAHSQKTLVNICRTEEAKNELHAQQIKAWLLPVRVLCAGDSRPKSALRCISYQIPDDVLDCVCSHRDYLHSCAVLLSLGNQLFHS